MGANRRVAPVQYFSVTRNETARTRVIIQPEKQIELERMPKKCCVPQAPAQLDKKTAAYDCRSVGFFNASFQRGDGERHHSRPDRP